MESRLKSAVHNACRSLLRPIASVLLKCGMTWKEFSDLSKLVFVQAATDDFGIRGRPTNVSRTSILTGISRKEVKRQRELLLETEPQLSNKTTDATRVLSGWHQDAEFLDDKAQPLPLVQQGPSPSFEALFARYGGDTPKQTLLKELKVGRCVKTDSKRRLVATSRYYMPVAMAEQNIRLFGSHIHDHAQTLNVNVAGDSKLPGRFEGRAANDQISPKAIAAFNKFVESRGQQFLEEVDDWLSRNQITESDRKTVPVRLGIGIYAVEGLASGETTK